MERNIFLFIGPPGCGKGTQVALLKRELIDAEFFGMGDYIRERRRKNQFFDHLCKTHMDSGGLLSLDILKGIVNEVIDDFYVSEKISLFFDGYPRTLEQCWYIYGYCTIQLSNVNIIPIIFEVPDDIVVARIVARGASSGRPDDGERVAQKRIKEYRENTLPVVDKLIKKGSCNLLRVDGTQEIGSIHNQILDFVKGFHSVHSLIQLDTYPVFVEKKEA